MSAKPMLHHLPTWMLWLWRWWRLWINQLLLRIGWRRPTDILSLSNTATQEPMKEVDMVRLRKASMLHFVLMLAAFNSQHALEMAKQLLRQGAADWACHRLAEAWNSHDDLLWLLTAMSLGVSFACMRSSAYRLASSHVIRWAIIDKTAKGRIDLLLAAVSEGVNLNFVIDWDQDIPLVIPGCFRGAKDDELSVSPAIMAVLSDRLHVLRLLHSLGVPLDRRERQGFTPVFFASAMGRVAALSFLLANRCSATTKSHSGFTAVHLCAMHCPAEAALDVLQLLIGRGAAADKADPSGKTPAHHFMDRGLQEPLRFLAGHRGCNPYKVLASHGVSLMEHAVRCGWDAEIRQRLVGSRNARQRQQRQDSCGDKEVRQVLVRAAESDRRHLLESLFASGCWPDDAQLGGSLVWAASAHTRTLRMLVTRLGISVDAEDGEDGETALTRATLEGRTDRVAELLSLGADPERRSAAGHSATEVAVKEVNDDRVFEELMELFETAKPHAMSRNSVESVQSSSCTTDMTPGSHGKFVAMERDVTIGIFGFAAVYRVIEYSIGLSALGHIIRKAKRGDLSILGELVADLRCRVHRHSRLAARASSAVSFMVPAVSVELPDAEYAAAFNETKLVELLYRLQHQVSRASDSSAGLRDRVSLCITVMTL